MIKEFKEFIARGNLIEIAVAFVMGVAFADVVKSLTDRIISPLIGMIFSLDGLDGMWTFGETVDGVKQGSGGAFLQALINFLIVAFIMFLIVKAYNTMKTRLVREEAAAETPPTEEVVLLREIRDSLNRR